MLYPELEKTEGDKLSLKRNLSIFSVKLKALIPHTICHNLCVVLIMYSGITSFRPSNMQILRPELKLILYYVKNLSFVLDLLN